MARGKLQTISCILFSLWYNFARGSARIYLTPSDVLTHTLNPNYFPGP